MFRGTREYHLVYAELIRAARARETLFYGVIAALMGIPKRGNFMSKKTGEILGEISEAEHTAGRPMLSALVVRTDGYPGAGFGRLARRLGKLRDFSQARFRAFWADERNNVWDTWQ